MDNFREPELAVGTAKRLPSATTNGAGETGFIAADGLRWRVRVFRVDAPRLHLGSSTVGSAERLLVPGRARDEYGRHPSTHCRPPHPQHGTSIEDTAR